MLQNRDLREATAFENAVFAGMRRVLGPSKKLLLAVSGGADSTALLWSMAEVAPRLGVEFEVGTVDHGLRDESVADAAFVQSLCDKLDVPVEILRLHLEPGTSVEARAREGRYQALTALRLRRGLDAVVTAHTANDQAETLLMRLSRGASLRGAAGILENAGGLLRPLLRVTRQQTSTYCALQGLVPREDSMNVDTQFQRVRVRRDVIPALERAIGPYAVANLSAFAAVAAEDDGHLTLEADAAWSRVHRNGALDAYASRHLASPILRRVLVRWLEQNQVTCDATALRGCVEALAQGGRATLPNDLLCDCTGAWVHLVPAPPRHP